MPGPPKCSFHSSIKITARQRAYGKINGEGTHAEVIASLEMDPLTYKYKGSASDEKDRARVAGNLGILFSEGFIWGNNAPDVYNEPAGSLFASKDNIDDIVPYSEILDDRNAPQRKPVYRYFSQQPEYVIKATKSTFGSSDNTTITNVNYLQLPVMINYITAVRNGKIALHAGVGVYIAYALSGKYKNGGPIQHLHLGNSCNDDHQMPAIMLLIHEKPNY